MTMRGIRGIGETLLHAFAAQGSQVLLGQFALCDFSLQSGLVLLNCFLLLLV